MSIITTVALFFWPSCFHHYLHCICRLWCFRFDGFSFHIQPCQFKTLSLAVGQCMKNVQKSRDSICVQYWGEIHITISSTTSLQQNFSCINKNTINNSLEDLCQKWISDSKGGIKYFRNFLSILFIRSPVFSQINDTILLFIYLLVYLFTYLFIYLFIYIFIYFFIFFLKKISRYQLTSSCWRYLLGQKSVISAGKKMHCLK